MKKNIIHSVQVEINTTSLATANAIKSSIDDVIKNEIFPRIERLLEQYQIHLGVDESLQIEELKLDLTLEKGELNSAEMISELAEQFERSLINLQNQKSNTPSKMRDEYLIDVQHPFFSTRRFSYYEKHLESLFFFIRTGTKPWWIAKGADLNKLFTAEKLSEVITSNKRAFAQRFLIEIQRESSRKRIFTQFSDETLIQFINHTFSVNRGKEITPENLRKITQTIKRVGLNERFRTAIWELILLQLVKSSRGTSQIELKPLVETIFRSLPEKDQSFWKLDSSPETPIKDLIKPVVQIVFMINNQQIPKQLQSEINILFNKLTERNESQMNDEFVKTDIKNRERIAQLDTTDVLSLLEKIAQQEQRKPKETIMIPEEGLHFDHAGLILLYPFLGHFFKQLELIDANQNLKDPEMAAHILHYIATGKENDWEFDMVFEKYLVEINIEESISKNRVITDSVKEEVNSLLKAFKSNWKPMMNSSNELLCYEFLQRPGKLVVDGQHHRIVMEKKTQDVLLNQLTWTINIVRFPWRDELLYVEW